jgi:hypothetical protein
MAEPIPIFVICRDRVTCTAALVDWLERAGQPRIYLVDNDSTYPGLLEYYETTPHQVVRLGQNVGPLDFWKMGLLEALNISTRYVVTDPDVVPSEDCPLDAVEGFAAVLDGVPAAAKVGFGLRIDDLPAHFKHRDEVIAWESQFWADSGQPGLYAAMIDTTFALYQAHVREHMIGPAIRTGFPYVARHTPWYVDSANRSEEDRYYLSRARGDVSNWNSDEKPNFDLPAEEPSVAVVVTKTAAVAEAIGDGREAADIRVNYLDDPIDLELEASPWRSEPTPINEQSYTAFAEPGWDAWNDMSPEKQFCEWVANTVMMFHPQVVIETGVGQGFLTRRLLSVLRNDQAYMGFESDPKWRNVIGKLAWFSRANAEIAAVASPPAELVAMADLLILDSDFSERWTELALWIEHGKPGSMLILHDAGNGHGPDTIHASLHEALRSLPFEGAFLNNPRGGCLAIKPAGRLSDFTASRINASR